MIVAMKKARIVVLKEDQGTLLSALQKKSIIMPIANNETNLLQTDDPFLQRAEKTLQILKKYSEKPKFGTQLIYSYDEFIEKEEKRQALVLEIENLDEEKKRLIEKQRELRDELNDLSLWKDLDVKLSEFNDFKYAKTYFGLIPKYNLDKLKAQLNHYATELIILGENQRVQAVIIIVYKEDEYLLNEDLKTLAFSEVSFPFEDKFFRDIISEKDLILQNNQNKLLTIENRLRDLGSQVNEIQVLIDQLASKDNLKKTPLTTTLETVYLEGWVKASDTEKLTNLLKETVEIFDVDYCDPKVGEIPPTALKNNRFTQIFEQITNTFSVPSTSELDPNPVMAPWYWILFGMMMGDVGYGAIMLILMFILIKIMKPKEATKALMQMLMVCGVTTIIWGVLFGSYFGATWNPILVEPMVEPMKMLIICMIVGAFHILTSLVFKAYQLIKSKRYLDALADSLSWMLIIIGLGLFASGLPIISKIGVYLALAGGVIVLFTAGREKPNLFGKISSGFTGLYGITGYISDIISYSRILALSLSTASVSMVMNLIAGMFGGALRFIFAPIVLILGHTLNLVMSLLSAYVHASRLQYIEFFGKFYEGNGYLFRPLSFKLKYVDEIKQNNTV